MQLHSLRLFVAVADNASFSAAAKQMHTVQSNVTAHIKKLESELGVTLFERQSHIHLTPAGHTLITHARRTLAAHDNARAAFQTSEAPRGVLRIGSMESTAAVRLPDLLAIYHKQYPLIDLRLVTGTTTDIVTQLLDGTLDCAFIAGSAPHSKLHSRKAFQESLVLVTSDPIEAMPSSDEFLETPFLAFRQGCHYRHCIERLLARQGIAGGRIFEFGSIDGILGCVAVGMGYALLPKAIVEAQQSRFAIHYLELPEDIGHVTTWFAATTPDGWSPALVSFERMVQTLQK
ncbi:DNA-binding transcriptional LysR family regulator [Kushneria sinocarnis]|uniref:DNA-binding transcriptional LysR family regulator n=1 Tax=Kushneria sinocarnis TaxID=595502 RepID=A0A420WW87_9GAMM|nr:LysR family transcriptional regulator [Kushneria sinocarnis]RKR03374.1 DNA-binding transcriptional LysR family regulator [Kushneria sinocarnis]